MWALVTRGAPHPPRGNTPKPRLGMRSIGEANGMSSCTWHRSHLRFLPAKPPLPPPAHGWGFLGAKLPPSNASGLGHMRAGRQHLATMRLSRRGQPGFHVRHPSVAATHSLLATSSRAAAIPHPVQAQQQCDCWGAHTHSLPFRQPGWWGPYSNCHHHLHFTGGPGCNLSGDRLPLHRPAPFRAWSQASLSLPGVLQDIKVGKDTPHPTPAVDAWGHRPPLQATVSSWLQETVKFCTRFSVLSSTLFTQKKVPDNSA